MPHMKLPDVSYLDSPVTIIFTRNHDGSVNLALISCILQLGDRCVFALDTKSRTWENIRSQEQCVVNVPSQ